jgi:hypothetical protein
MESATKQLSFIERMQEAAAKRNDNVSTLTDDQKSIIRDIKTLKNRILDNYQEKMHVANSQSYVINGQEYAPHYVVLWDSALETDESIKNIDIDKIMSNGYIPELPEGNRFSKNFLSILQSGLPPDHKVYISCKYVIYMFWKMDMFADRLYQYCDSHMISRIVDSVGEGRRHTSIWSMEHNYNVIPELGGSDIDALLRHKYKVPGDSDRLSIVQRLQQKLDSEEFNNGYDPTTGNKLTIAAIYAMPRTRNISPYQIVVWRVNLNSSK